VRHGNDGRPFQPGPADDLAMSWAGCRRLREGSARITEQDTLVMVSRGAGEIAGSLASAVMVFVGTGPSLGGDRLSAATATVSHLGLLL